MILKGNQRGGAMNLARHLLQGENEHVTLHELRGFTAHDLGNAFREVEAVSKGTRCRQYLFSLSLNPPEGEQVSELAFEKAVNDIEHKLGLDGQPRAIVFHEKEGRRHAHAVWSRIDTENMRAINLPHYKRKLQDKARALCREHEWQMPDGLRERGQRDPLNFTRAEWQQAKRTQSDPRDIKALFRECWHRADSRDALASALQEKGFWLARGDRRGIVAVDYHGEPYALGRWTGVKAKELKARLGDPQALPDVGTVKDRIAGRMTGALKNFIKEIETDARKHSAALEFRRGEMAGRHREDRATLKEQHEKRWIAETRDRAARLPKGIGGLWQRVTGRYGEIRRQNERETWQAHLRDRSERDELVLRQIEERQELQRDIKARRRQQQAELLALRADVARYQDMHTQSRATPERSRDDGKPNDNARNRRNDRGRGRERGRTPKP